MSSCILQIDGTTDSDFAMIIVVRDAASGSVLHSERCFSESEENMTRVSESVKGEFGIPSGAICDMRSGILSAIGKAFPGIPTMICLLYFLHDLSMDMMLGPHTDPSIMINRIGIKSRIKAILRLLPEYDYGTIIELENGFCNNPGSIEIMRRMLEKLIAVNSSSGYGLPFSLRHLNFYKACIEARKDAKDLIKASSGRESSELLDRIMLILTPLTENTAIKDPASSLDSTSRIFQAFRMLDKGNLSDTVDIEMPGKRTGIEMAVHVMCSLYLKSRTPPCCVL
jgi:hypothetical protein